MKDRPCRSNVPIHQNLHVKTTVGATSELPFPALGGGAGNQRRMSRPVEFNLQTRPNARGLVQLRLQSIALGLKVVDFILNSSTRSIFSFKARCSSFAGLHSPQNPSLLLKIGCFCQACPQATQSTVFNFST